MPLLSRAIMGSRDLIRDTAEAQRMALLFERIFVWHLDRDEELPTDEIRRTEDEINFLRSAGLAMSFGMQMPTFVTFTQADGTVVDPFAAGNDDCDVLIPYERVAVTSNPDGLQYHADVVVASLARQLEYHGAPVVAHVSPSRLQSPETVAATALEIAVKGIPLPAEAMPWDDFLQFRADEENVARLRALRLWIQKRATSAESVKIMEDELADALHQYRTYMDIQKIKYGDGVLSTVITAAKDLLVDLTSANFGSGVGKLFEIRKHNLALKEAELKAPGREVAYIARASEFFGR
jgi:hypothetical protein